RHCICGGDSANAHNPRPHPLLVSGLRVNDEQTVGKKIETHRQPGRMNVLCAEWENIKVSVSQRRNQSLQFGEHSLFAEIRDVLLQGTAPLTIFSGSGFDLYT